MRAASHILTSPMLPPEMVRMLNRVTHRDRITATQLAANLGLPSFADLVNIPMLTTVGKKARMPPHRMPRQVLCAWMEGTRPQGRPRHVFWRRLTKIPRTKLAGFPGRAAFGTQSDEIATWHCAQDEDLWNNAMLKHST